MAVLRVPFREMNTDIPPQLLPSGTADDVLNIDIIEGRITKRAGFAKIDATATTVRMHWANGQLYTRTTAGWFFDWAGRTYFSNASTIIYSTSGDFAVSVTAGMPRPTGSPTVAASASAGSKEGEYNVHMSLRDSVTNEEGAISLPQATENPLETRASDDDGAITVSGLNAMVPAGYGATHKRIYCTNGDTERANGIASRSMEAFFEAEITVGTDSVDIAWPDFVHGSRSHPRYTNAGGLPTPTVVGLFDGSQGVYPLSTGLVEFSVPGFPTMIPARQFYTMSGSGWSFSAYVEPAPWPGDHGCYVGGTPIVAVFGGGQRIVFTANEAYRLVNSEDGRLFSRRIPGVTGVESLQGAIGTPSMVHALGRGHWQTISFDGKRNTSRNHWNAIIDDLVDPATAIVGYFGWNNQIWLADDQGDSSSVIWIIDASSGTLISKWVAAIGTVQAMVEAVVSDEPSMYVATDTGLWRYTPALVDLQYDDNTTAFAAHWQGYFGQERSASTLTLSQVKLFIEKNIKQDGTVDAGEIQIAISGMGTDVDPTPTAATVIGVGRDNRSVQFDRDAHGNYFRVKISSAANKARSWSINDLILHYSAVGR